MTDLYSVFDGASRVLSGASRPEAFAACEPGFVVAREQADGPAVPAATVAGVVVCPARKPAAAVAVDAAPASAKKASPRRGRAAKETKAT